MNYYRYNENFEFIGVTETKPKDNLWTNEPYVDSFEQPKWDGEKWIESAPFDLKKYAEKINELHNALFEKMYKAKNYLTIGEISLWVTDAEYGAEAQSLMAWWRNSCKLVETHIENADENSNAEEFIKSL